MAAVMEVESLSMSDDQLSPWQLMPDDLIVLIFSNLNTSELCAVAQTCEAWKRVSYDEFLWKDLFYQDWKVSPSIPIAPTCSSWRSEYRRLAYHTPIEQCEVLTEHENQVLHVSFSHNGKWFATSSKDAHIMLWSASYPVKLKHKRDMREFSWKYTQFSQFNETDTLLLVSGVHFGSHTTSGEIAVFNVERGGFLMQCRVPNKPYDIFGTWYNENYLLSGDLKWLGHLVSSSLIWLNKASQWDREDIESEHKSVVTEMYRFYNKNASSIRTIMVANCVSTSLDDKQEPEALNSGQSPRPAEPPEKGNPVSHRQIASFSSPPPVRQPMADLVHHFYDDAPHDDRPFVYLNGYHYRSASEGDDPPGEYLSHRRNSPEFGGPHFGLMNSADSGDTSDEYSSSDEDSSPSEMNSCPSQSAHLNFCVGPSVTTTDGSGPSKETRGEVILDEREKLLIFTTGSKTYTPHQIGFKRIKPFRFQEHIHINLQQRLAERRERKLSPHTSPNWPDEASVQYMFEKVDHLIDLNGHIIGMALSPDHRYLYVNSRPWPQGCNIEHPLTPPPIAQEIDIHVIDLVTLQEVGTMLRSHRAYTPNDECFFIFLDVSNQYVASGAEDKHGYIWDRHYGICLRKLPHSDVVNSVAFNPQNPEMLVTASDDYTIKVWRSHNAMKYIREQEAKLLRC